MLRSGVAVLLALPLLCNSAAPAIDEARMATVSLTITRVKQIDNVDATRAGELYARVKINERSFPKTGHREDDGDVRPDWTFTTVVEYRGRGAYSVKRMVPFRIDIWDEDYPDRDDHCDASPARGRKQLYFYYSFRTETIDGDLSGEAGSVLHARGAGDGNRVEVWFRIDIALAR
jgi:hypothetical protein